MKRSPELTALSHDHHHGLVLVQEIQAFLKAAPEGDENAIWRKVHDVDAGELQPHFAIEETYLGEPLGKHDEQDAVSELLRQHAELRELLCGRRGETRDSLAALAERLTDHIRYEERVFFPLAEKILTPEELKAVERASQQARRDRCDG